MINGPLFDPFSGLFSQPSPPDPIIPARRDPDEEIRRALRNTTPSRGRNFLTINPTNGLSIYDMQNPQAGSSGLNLPPNQ